MASLTDTSIRRPVATTMFYLVLVTLGVVGFMYLPVDLLPRIEFPRLTVTVDYPNVGPEEMETIITDPLENELSGIPNLERMTSRSEEGRSRVILEFGRGTNIDEAANDVRAAIDRLRDDLPIEAEPPAIWKFDPDATPIMTLSVESTRDLASTTRLLQREIVQRFSQIPGVGAIDIWGGVYREIQVRLLRDRLRASGLTGTDVADALARENVQLPGGDVKKGVSDLYVRTLGEYRSLDEIRSTVIRVVDGRPIRVRDVAEVVDGYEDVRNLAEVNGVPVVRLSIQKQSGANTVEVADRILEEVARINQERPDLNITIDSDQSTFIRQSIDSVRDGAVWGAFLAIAILYIFLRNGSTTFIVALAIPISIAATLGLLFFSGLTLNQMTFGGLALGIGMLVDNAIVVVENIVRQRENGRPPMEAASVGTREVCGAVVASTLTTCVIFLPVVFMRTTSGQLFQTLALVVVFSLACSLFVALTLVPVLSSRFLTIRPAAVDERGESHSASRPHFMEVVDHWYTTNLARAIAHRGRVFAATAALVLAAAVVFPFIPVELAPEMDTDEIDVEIEMARGTNIAVAKEYLSRLEAIVRPLLPEGEVRVFATEVRGDGDAEVEIQLVEPGRRSIDPSVLADRLREATAGRIPGAEIRVDAGSGLWVLRRLFSASGGNEEIEVQLRGYDLEQARTLAREIKARMERAEGVVEVDIGEREGRPEENLRFDRERIYAMGLSVEEVARSIQTSVGGVRAGYYREGGEQFPIVVRLRPEDRLTAQDLQGISVRTPDGQTLPVSTFVRRESGRGPTEINRIDGQRVTYITANLERGVALGTAIDRIREQLAGLQLPSDFSIAFGGAYREQQQAQRDFVIAIILALVLVYMVMAGQFERFLDPLVVMFSVPVALIGVVPALVLTGTTINVQSVMGMAMLIGIVVNNAIVLVDYINFKRREEGMSPEEAVQAAGRTRLRPILMTTATTVLGLLPLGLGFGAGAGLQAALARTVIGGLTASTIVTLFLIPTLYLSATTWAEQAREAIARRFGRAPASQPAQP
ncbi:MAG TPA: efflux RND transporter permease subunit [Vicinamibacterales bacterium]|nr:efflux RND transporter permease subunit [Vicinamibacterales bacterium]